MLLHLQLINNEVLKGFGFEGCSKLSIPDFLPTVNNSILPNPFLIHTLTLPSMSDFTGVNATEPRTSANHPLASNPIAEYIQIRVCTEECCQRFCGLQELGRGHGIVLLLVDRNVGEGSLESVEECSSLWVCLCCHLVCRFWVRCK